MKKLFIVHQKFPPLLHKDIATYSNTTPFSFPKSCTSNIIHCTTQTLALPLLYSQKKCIVTVHDLIPLVTKNYTSFVNKIQYFFIKYALKKAVHIIADSEHTKKDIIIYINYPEEKITVIPLGIDHSYFFKRKVKKKKNTILFVGSDAKRKNIELIIQALPLIQKKIPDIQFIKVGEPQDMNMRKYLEECAKKAGVADKIIWKNYVDSLAEEYSSASCFVFPSLYEGFGFPVLEAMACGCPVITTQYTSLPEIAGDAALYCDGHNPEDLAENIIAVLLDSSLQKSLERKGIERAKKFTWKRCAQESQEVYRKSMY
jgi:glycosyltransferase involved in cell wall biosynthesis